MCFLCDRKHLVLSGGGCNALLHLGALDFASQVFFTAHRTKLRFAGVSGTSAGALVGLGIAAGLEPQTMLAVSEQIMPSLPDIPEAITNLQAMSATQSHEPLFCAVHTLLELAGFDRNVTFAQFHRRTRCPLFVGASNLSTDEFELLSFRTHPNLSVAAAVVAAMSVPLVFPPFELAPGTWYQDGGLQCNLPTQAFADLDKTLALWIHLERKKLKIEGVPTLTTIARKCAAMIWATQDNAIRSRAQVEAPSSFVELKAEVPGFLLLNPGVGRTFDRGRDQMARHVLLAERSWGPLLATWFTEVLSAKPVLEAEEGSASRPAHGFQSH